MGIDNSGPIQSFNEEIEQNKKSNLNSNNSKKNNNNNNININLNSSYSGFCGNFSSNDIINNKKKTEIDLTTTFSSAKGTYTKESYKLFSQNEKNFFYLVQKNNITGIRYLIIHGVNINILDEERTSPLHIACKESSIQTIEEIIFQGSMINIPDLVGWTPLHMACYYNRPDVVLLLLKSGANYNTHNRDKLSARDLAIKCGNYNCAKVLDNFIYYQKIEKEKCLNEINVRNLKNGKNLENMKNEEEDLEQPQDDIYEEVLKKYILYQNLKREFLQGNEDILSNNEEIESSKNEENEMSDIVNDEFYPTAEIQQKNNIENMELHEIEKCLNLLNIQMTKNKEKNTEEVKNKYDLMLSKYKFIPKKHKFYLKYEYKNGKFMVKSKNEMNSYEYEFDIRKPKFSNNNQKTLNKDGNSKSNINKNLIHMHSIPSIIPLRNLNTLKIKTYSKNNLTQKIDDSNNKQNSINSEEEKQQMEEEEKMYKPYNYYGEDEEDNDNNNNDINQINIDSNNEEDNINSNLELFLSEFNKKVSKNFTYNKNKNIKSMKNKDNNSSNNSKNNDLNISNESIEEEDEEKTISLEDENLNFLNENLNTNNNQKHKDQKIFLAPFEINRTPNKEIVKYFLEHNDIYEDVLQILFHFDYVFALQFLMSISDIDNSIVSLINYISNNIFNSRLRLEILNLMNYKNKSTILESYFSLLNTQNNSIFQNIKKIIKIFDLTTNDIKLIEQLSFSFSKIYYERSKENSSLNKFKSQNAIYYFVFAFIITQLSYNQNTSNKKIDKEKIICDFIIMIKNLNEGKNYENDLIIEAINEIKKNKEPITFLHDSVNYEKKLFNIQIRRIKDNVLMSCLGYFDNGIFIVFNNKKEIVQIINLQLDKNISCNIVSHSHKICFTSLQNKIVEIINIGNTLEYQKSLFFEVYIQNNKIMNDINKYFQDKRYNILK